MKKILCHIILITATSFAQTKITPINNVAPDSAALEQLYQYNLDKYNFDKKAANIAEITMYISAGLAAVSTIPIIIYDLEQHSESSDLTELSMSHPLIVTALVICGIGFTSALVYGGFEIAAAVRKGNYMEYNIQKKKYATTSTASIRVAPFISPINKSYGGALTLNF